MSNGKGDNRRPRDDRYCTEKQYSERFAAVFEKGKSDEKHVERKRVY